MSTQVQSLKLDGMEFVVLERSEYERLRALEQSADSKRLPDWPEADSKGNRPALEFARVSIARDIIKERTALGLTQQELAKLAGVRQETLCRLETGKHSPNVRTVDKIDAALKIAQRRSARSAKGKSGIRKI
ncbi:MAG TPA: helix-turn-helix domain-containing protein [Lacipirellulaceae bacterium]|jgi:DNA-binding XRE family transcriptional regulator|nr:helix-turn-helix domain-containing protein [Lacipirellulaceae bacterium]